MGDIASRMESFIDTLIRLMVDKPEEVKVTVSITTKLILVQISVSKPDIGKVIGKNGRTIDSLKIIATVVKNTQYLGDKKVVSIEINE